MESILLCEGATDFSLLQTYMRETNNWQEDPTIQQGLIKIPNQKSRVFKRGSDLLTVMATGGCSRIPDGVGLVLKRIYSSAPPFNTAYKKIAIVTDNDEISTESDMINQIKKKVDGYSVLLSENLTNKKWISCKMKTNVGLDYEFEILLLVIPFSQQGAMETFLLNAIADNDPYDAKLILQSKNFVSQVDLENKYLTKKSYKIKAEFSTFFCIRTPAEAFSERQTLMRTGINWSNYSLIQKDFIELAEL